MPDSLIDEHATVSTPPDVLARRLRPLANKPPGSLVVHEIYRSLQGESTFAGLPCVFVRLTACHLRCGYCDTPHAFHQGETLALDDVLARALAFDDRLVELTGLLETSGAVGTERVDPRVHVILDLKTPGSGEVEANVWSNVERLSAKDEVKFVLCDRADFDWAVAQVRAHRLTDRCPVHFSPTFGRVNPTELATWVLESGLPVRLQVQLHKILWDPNARGV
jgi:7-carboxy-7-deazaguanine synthase